MAQQDDYYYEIQLSNKQLVFYFLAGATGLILSFLAGVMVGRGVDNSTGVAEAAPRPALEERIVPEEPAKPSPPAAEELTYAQRLEADKAADSLERPAKSDAPAPSAKPADKTPATTQPAAQKASPRPSPAARPSPKATPAPPKASATKASTAKPEPGSLSIQVGAFKDRDTAESVVARLKKKGYTAYVIAPAGADGLFNVRVGSYAARADAEKAEAKLRDEEKFKPFIVKN